MNTIRIEALRSLRAIEPLRAQVDALNLASRRPCPYATFEYLQTFLAHDESGTPDNEVLFLAAFEGDALVGYLPLRKYRDRIRGIPYGRIGVLVSHDTDRPHLVARREDEARCCEALYRHLLDREPGWSFLEIGFQDAESGLNVVPALSPLRHYARRFDTMPNTTLALTFASFADYYGKTSSNQRKNMSRLVRRLFAAGQVEIVSTSDPRARAPMLELYMDLERRSWKELACAGIRRHPERIAFFRALCAGNQPLGLAFELVLLDGVPVSGLVNGEFAGSLYGLEMAFDQDYEDLAPGHLLSLIAIQRAIEGKYHSFNFDGNYAYYKARLGGVVTPTSAVQIYRVGSLPWLRARAGELKRRFRPPPHEAQNFNPERRRVSQEAAPADESDTAPRRIPSARPRRNEERERARATFEALEKQGVVLERLSQAALERILPFSTRKKAA